MQSASSMVMQCPPVAIVKRRCGIHLYDTVTGIEYTLPTQHLHYKYN